VDADDGWQYSRDLNDPDDTWTATIPPPLERLLTGSGLVAAGLSGPGPSSRSATRTVPRRSSGSNLVWARRRRWVCRALRP
jgi:hypothetical protein